MSIYEYIMRFELNNVWPVTLLVNVSRKVIRKWLC